MIYTLRQFSVPDNLAKLHPENLLQFLKKYPDYFDGVISRFVIPEVITKDFNYTQLASEFANPIFDGDTKMFDDLALIEEMARDRYVPVVLEHLQTVVYKMDFAPEAQALNNALLVFLREPERLVQFRQELQLENPKSFIVLRGGMEKPPFDFKDDYTALLQKSLDDIYAARKYGRGIVVRHFHVKDGEYFLIRKGLPHTYQPTIGKDYSTVGLYYRPELFDIVIYNPIKNELKIAFGGERKWMRNTYSIIFGKIFFGKEDFFESNRMASFSIFEEKGEEALTCLPGEMISHVTVDGITVERYAENQTLLEKDDSTVVLTQEYHIKDFFQNASLFNLQFKGLGHIIGLKLVFHFGPKDKKTIILSENKCLGLKLDAKGILIEQWLYEHGFFAA